MFFIGIFGINQSDKFMETCNNTICPYCGGFTRFEVSKRYSYFHMFFIPFFKWDTRYFVKTSCCKRIYELDSDIGKQFDKGENPEILNDYLNPLNDSNSVITCSNCKVNIQPDYSFCPYCGKKIP